MRVAFVGRELWLIMGVKLIDPAKRKYRVAFWYKNRHYVKIVTGNKRLASEVEATMRAGLAEGTFFPERAAKKVPVSDVVERFLVECPTFKSSAHKFKIYAKEIGRFFHGKTLYEVTPGDVQRFREYLSQRMTPVSVNHYQRVMRRMINWAGEVGLFKGENPASGNKVPLANERPFWRTRFLSEDEIKKLLGGADARIRPIIMCAVFSGMRLGELKRMRKVDVDLDRCIIRIPITKNGEPGYVPMPNILYSVLEAISKGLPIPDCLVFDFLNFERLWRQARKDAGLQDIHFHDLRHTYASHLMMKTGNPAVVQNLLRHKTPLMTQRYSHLAPGYLRTAVLSLDELLAPEQVPENRPTDQKTDHCAVVVSPT